jgi:DNA repair exonuclease SbcCD nuclease subunit
MIKKIIHLSDVHIRTLKYHDLFRRQFQLLIDDVSEQIYATEENIEPNEVRIVITGDLFDQKINISNELTLMVSSFLRDLSSIGKVVLIPGNHDFLEHNTDRIDSITPVVELLQSKNIVYYKDSGVYEDENINWVVYSLYQHNQRPSFENDGKKIYIGLFHGQIQGLSTDLGFKFDDGYDRLNFIGLDLLLCGDIHLRQVFELPNKRGKAIMIGSFIQNNFGESVNCHGYGIYDLKTDEYTFHDIPNEQPFLHFEIKDITDLDDGKEILLNLK